MPFRRFLAGCAPLTDYASELYGTTWTANKSPLSLYIGCLVKNSTLDPLPKSEGGYFKGESSDQ